jgi:hypothetical protein
MANKKRTLKRRKIRGGFFGNEDKQDVVVESNVSKEEPKEDQINDPNKDSTKEAAVRSPETVSKTPETDNTPWYTRWFGFGGKRKTNKRKTKRNRSQKR